MMMQKLNVAEQGSIPILLIVAKKLKEGEISVLYSLLVTRNLLRTVVVRMRGLFPEKSFGDKSVSALDMETEPRRLIDCVEKGVYDALQRKDLKKMVFCICETVDGPMIEVHFSDFDSQEVMMNVPAQMRKTPDEIQIFVKHIADNTITIDARSSDTVFTVKRKVERRTRIPGEEQRLIFAGRELEDFQTLEHYGIIKESTLHLALHLIGGMEHQPAPRRVGGRRRNPPNRRPAPAEQQERAPRMRTKKDRKTKREEKDRSKEIRNMHEK